MYIPGISYWGRGDSYQIIFTLLVPFLVSLELRNRRRTPRFFYTRRSDWDWSAIRDWGFGAGWVGREARVPCQSFPMLKTDGTNPVEVTVADRGWEVLEGGGESPEWG